MSSSGRLPDDVNSKHHFYQITIRPMSKVTLYPPRRCMYSPLSLGVADMRKHATFRKQGTKKRPQLLSLSAARSSDPFTRPRRHCGRRQRMAGHGIKLTGQSRQCVVMSTSTRYGFEYVPNEGRLRQSIGEVHSSIQLRYVLDDPTIQFHSSHYTRPEASAHRLTSCGLVLIPAFGWGSVTLYD